MKYFIDTEFLEGDVPIQIFGVNIPKKIIKPNNTIQPISVGIVSSDDREYYAISKEFNLKEAWNRFQIEELKGSFNEATKTSYKSKIYWIRDNVLLPIYLDKVHGDMRNSFPFTYSTMKGIIKGFGKTNKQIAEEIKDFINGIGEDISIGHGDKEFYGYYCDYDHVVLCQLYGKMIDLPKGFPYYMIDIQQIIDSNKINKKELIKEIPQINSHNALQDALWNMKAYKYINNILKDGSI